MKQIINTATRRINISIIFLGTEDDYLATISQRSTNSTLSCNYLATFLSHEKPHVSPKWCKLTFKHLIDILLINSILALHYFSELFFTNLASILVVKRPDIKECLSVNLI